jgi:large repetitive protein
MHGLARSKSRAALVAVLAAGALAVSGVAASAATLAPTTTTLKVAVTTAVNGQLVRMKVTVQESLATGLPTGTVTINDSGTPVGTGTLANVNGVMTAIVKIAFHPGTRSLTATYKGDSLNATSSAGAVSLLVSKAATTVSVTNTALSNPGAYKIAAVIKVTKPGAGIPTGSVTFVVDGGPPTPVALDSVGHAHIFVKFTVGTSHSVSVSYAGDSNFTSNTGSLTFTA